jgi:hypothetical protein
MELAHPPVGGSFGPAGRHIVLLYRPQGDDGEFKGVVYLAGEQPSDLPPLDLIPNHFTVEVEAVFFERAEIAAEPSLIILYSYHRNGSDSADGHACAIYSWRGNQFVRLMEVEKKVASLSTASAVRQRLRESVPSPSKRVSGGLKK